MLSVQAPSELKEGATFEEYLSTVFPEDDVKEQYIDPLSLKGAPRAMSRTSTDDVSVCWKLLPCIQQYHAHNLMYGD